MTYIREVFNRIPPGEVARNLLNEGNGGIVSRFGNALSQIARAELVAITQEGMRKYRTSDRRHLNVVNHVRRQGEVYRRVHLFGVLLKTLPTIVETGIFSSNDFVKNYNAGISGVPFPQLNTPLVPDEIVPVEQLEQMKALREEDPTYASHLIAEQIPDGLRKLLTLTQDSLALTYHNLKKSGYAEWFQTYGKELAQHEVNGNGTKPEDKSTSQVVQDNPDKSLSSSISPARAYGRYAGAYECILCHFETELDDTISRTAGGRCVCVRCYGRETGSAKPMPKGLRRELSAALADADYK